MHLGTLVQEVGQQGARVLALLHVVVADRQIVEELSRTTREMR
jgi:hypothetical protein